MTYPIEKTMNPTENDQRTRQEAMDIGSGISVDLSSTGEMMRPTQPIRALTRLRLDNVEEERTDRDRTRDRIRRMPGISDAFWRGYTGRERREEREE